MYTTDNKLLITNKYNLDVYIKYIYTFIKRISALA